MRMGDIERQVKGERRSAWSLCCMELRWMVRHLRKASCVLRAIEAEALISFNQASRLGADWPACAAAGLDAARQYVKTRCEPTPGKASAPSSGAAQ